MGKDATAKPKLKDYPTIIRDYVQATPLHLGVKASLLETVGNLITAFSTNTPHFNLPELDRRHRVRRRGENRSKTLKYAGLGWEFGT